MTATSPSAIVPLGYLCRVFRVSDRGGSIYVLLMVLLISPTLILGQSSSTCDKAMDIFATSSVFHIAPKQLDDTLSAAIFSNFIESLDPSKVLFSDQDYADLTQYQYRLDEVLQGQSCHLIDEIADIYITKVGQLRSSIMAYEASDIHLNNADTLYFVNETNVTPQHLAQQWKDMFKMRVLLRIADQDSTIQENEILTSQVSEALEKIIATELCVIEDQYEFSTIEERKNNVHNEFLKAIAISMDPHTAYMTMDEKASFLESLQSETLSFGFSLSTNLQGEYEISNLIPGGPAWSSNQIEEQDLLTGIIDKEGKILLADCRNISTISDQLKSSEIREVTFMIRDKLGKTSKVTLSKDFETTEENIIQSFILKGDNKIAYIQLPSFYSSSDDYNGTVDGCTDHVARELIRLQQEDINGLILDLRYNGGGSILEAIRMGGMFINYGPIAIAKYRDEKPKTLKDMDRGRAYRGPLTILVNSFSASASELMAGAMQDYNRAVIVGTPTHGKGSIQSIMPSNVHELDEDSTEDDVSPDFLKTTVGKYYRITGKGVQNIGITPDVVVPDYFDLDIFREKNNDNALPYSTITKKTYYKPLKSLPLESLAKNSSLRLSKISDIEKITEIRQGVLLEHKGPRLLLSLENIRSLQKENKYEYESSIKGDYQVTLPTHKQALLQQNEQQIKLSEMFQKDLLEDLQVIEAFQITTELISATKN